MKNKKILAIVCAGAILAGLTACGSAEESTETESSDSVTTESAEESSEECTSLVNVTLPSTLERIDAGAFAECTALRSITVPDDCEIMSKAFIDCKGLTVTYKGNEYNYKNAPDWFGF